MMQRMLPGEADGAVDLMGNPGAGIDRLVGPELAGSDLEPGPPPRRGLPGGTGRTGNGRRFPCENRELLLNRLKVTDRPSELAAVLGVLDRPGEKCRERAGTRCDSQHGAIGE